MITLSRRSALTGIICAPAIVRASSLMPIKALEPYAWTAQYQIYDMQQRLIRGNHIALVERMSFGMGYIDLEAHHV